MNVLFLGTDIKVWDEIRRFDLVFPVSFEIGIVQVEGFNIDLIISYNYRFILPLEILRYPRLGAWNIHISYLPYNKGSDPNLWSHIEGTPPGVTIHMMDEGIDTGPILTQKLIQISEKSDLKKSYEKLHHEARILFAEVYPLIRSRKYRLYRHHGGTYHKSADKPKLWNGYSTTVEELKREIM